MENIQFFLIGTRYFQTKETFIFELADFVSDREIHQ